MSIWRKIVSPQAPVCMTHGHLGIVPLPSLIRRERNSLSSDCRPILNSFACLLFLLMFSFLVRYVVFPITLVCWSSEPTGSCVDRLQMLAVAPRPSNCSTPTDQMCSFSCCEMHTQSLCARCSNRFSYYTRTDWPENPCFCCSMFPIQRDPQLDPQIIICGLI